MEQDHNALNNLPPFYVGQKVVSLVNGIKFPELKKGNTYTVLSIHKFSCGCHGINVGIKITHGSLFIKCCGESTIIPHNGIKYHRSEIFTPLQHAKFPLLKLTRVIEEQLIAQN